MKTMIIIIIGLLFPMFVQAESFNLQTIFKKYINIKDALIASDADSASEEAKELVILLTSKTNDIMKQDKDIFLSKKESLIEAAIDIRDKEDIESKRTAFATLSTLLWSSLKESKDKLGDMYYFYCPMKKAYWLSTEKTVRNPYFGKKMMNCGKIKETR